jgi:hypothetical protein
MTGSTGATGATGITGATGVSPFSFVGATTNITYTAGNVVLGNTIVTSFQEGINTTAALTGTAFTIVYNASFTGTVYTLGTITSNYSLNVGFLPSVTNPLSTYVISLINPNGNNYMCSAVSVGTATTYTPIPLFYSGGNVVSSSTNFGFSTQQIIFVYSGGRMVALSTFVTYS